MVEIIPLRLPEMETPRALDDWSAGPSWRDPRLSDLLPNRFLPPDNMACGTRKGRAEFERRQLIATGRVSSLYGVHQKIVPPQNTVFASRQPGYHAAVIKRQAMREEADELSQLFDAQASERAFLAAFGARGLRGHRRHRGRVPGATKPTPDRRRRGAAVARQAEAAVREDGCALHAATCECARLSRASSRRRLPGGRACRHRRVRWSRVRSWPSCCTVSRTSRR